MIAKLQGAVLQGMEPLRVQIEVQVGRGVGVNITGLPDDTIRESIGRIASSLRAAGFQMPRTRINVHLLPAGFRKTGTTLDLPIALCILIASGQIAHPGSISNCIIAGELGLDGRIHPIRGALSLTSMAAAKGFGTIILPDRNSDEASLETNIKVLGYRQLKDLTAHLRNEAPILESDIPKAGPGEISVNPIQLDLLEVRGQKQAKRALEIAAAGGHNLLLTGAPGSGKTMLAQRFPSILPPLTPAETLEVNKWYSVLTTSPHTGRLITTRPIRSPHHSSTEASLIGGGRKPGPGEITRAHLGVLFLDELPEFRRDVLEALREPLEAGKVTIARASGTVEYPSDFQLVAAMNPCPCGYFGHPYRQCSCHPASVRWYRRKISGPLMERIDVHVKMEHTPFNELFNADQETESSADIRERVIRARKIQSDRLSPMIRKPLNAAIPEKSLLSVCEMEDAAKSYLQRQMKALQFSNRSFSKILKIARTIADLDDKRIIELRHIGEAIHYRSLDRPFHEELADVKRTLKIYRAS